jgi:hypothetical protein
MTMDRRGSVAYRALPPSAKRALATIEAHLGGAKTAKVSYLDFMDSDSGSGIGKQNVSRAIHMLCELGFVTRRRGERHVSIFALSTGWQRVTEQQAMKVVDDHPPPPSKRPRYPRPKTFGETLSTVRI